MPIRGKHWLLQGGGPATAGGIGEARMSRSTRRRAGRVDLAQGESFGFLGFDFRRVRSRCEADGGRSTRRKLKKRTALLRKLKEVFRRYRSQPVSG